VNGRGTAAFGEEFLFLVLSGWTFRKYGTSVSIIDVWNWKALYLVHVCLCPLLVCKQLKLCL